MLCDCTWSWNLRPFARNNSWQNTAMHVLTPNCWYTVCWGLLPQANKDHNCHSSNCANLDQTTSSHVLLVWCDMIGQRPPFPQPTA